jgi:inosine-uridine nucleoside N-ribohydrolase
VTTALAQKIIIDADPGICDALAILVAMADPAVDVLALTAVSGAVSGIQATRNLHYLIGLADPLRHPRVGQSDIADCSADQMPSGMPHLQALNGRFGLGEIDPLVPDLHNRRESAKLIVDIVREYPQEVRILTFGPLTNVAMALDLDPELPLLLNGVICQGGVMQSGGDVTAAAEFNIWSDPEAARTVMKSPVGKILVPLNVTQGPGLSFEDIDRLSGLIPSTPVGEMIVSLMQFAVRANRQHMPQEEVSLPAVSTLAVASRAAAFATESVILDVETTGDITVGMTVIDSRPFRSGQTNAEVVTELDLSAVIDYFCRGVRRIAVSSDGRS